VRRAGADHVTAVPDGVPPTTKHVLGGMRLGSDPATSATDAAGRYHHLDNLFVADGSVFPTSGTHNPTPTPTLMATALRNARRWV
jgi:choline dehydrogenase-like flavoprotein